LGYLILTVVNIQEFSLQVPQQPKNAIKNIIEPATNTTIDPVLTLFSTIPLSSPEKLVILIPK
jgi:hypothetical protein